MTDKNPYVEQVIRICNDLGAVSSSNTGNLVKATFDRQADAIACAELLLGFWWVEQAKPVRFCVFVKVAP